METAIPGLLDLSVKYGNELIKRYKSYKAAGPEIEEATLHIAGQWLRQRHQLEFLRSVWDDLGEEYQTHLDAVLQVLYGKLQKSISSLNSVLEKDHDKPSTSGTLNTGPPRRIKYATLVKKSLLQSIKDLEKWRELFDPSWWLLIRLSNKDVDAKLSAQPIDGKDDDNISTLRALRDIVFSDTHSEGRSGELSVFSPGNSIQPRRSPIAYSRAEVWECQNPHKHLIVDENSLNSTSSNLSDIRTLAKILRRARPLLFGVLQCETVYKYAQDEGVRCHFAFAVPDDLQHPQSLREILLKSGEQRCLNDKFDLARQLAKSVMFVHSANFVHKNIRPETIVLLESKETATRWPFLTGFEKFRLAGGKTDLRGDKLWEENLYRHPKRQGIHPEIDYLMQHDIYSLGVCLLEIGMGYSFVLWTASNSSPTPHDILATDLKSLTKGVEERALELKACLVALAQKNLPSKMGTKYTAIVIMCLTCLDKTGNSFGRESEFLDEDGIQVGVRYIEKILIALQEISL